MRSEQGNKKNDSNSNSENKPKINFGEMLKGHANVPNLGSQPAQMMVEEEEEKPTQKKAIQKKTMAEEEEELQMKEAPEKKPKSSVTSGTKASLPDSVKGKMENSFGTDFSSVNIHKDSGQATNMGALAYTQGNDVHFAPGQYNPESSKGQELIGHELTHVVQQRQGRVKPTKEQGKGLAVNDNPSLENEADEKGERAAHGETVEISGMTSHSSIMKKDEIPNPGIHIVQRGDNYSELAIRYGVSVEDLRNWNGYKDTEIPIGAKLIVSPNLTSANVISSSTRRPLLDPNNPNALRDDLVFGDKTNDEIVQEGEDYLINLYRTDGSKTNEQLFNNFHTMATELFTSRDMTPVLREMINFFESNTGGDLGQEFTPDGMGYAIFENEHLNEVVLNSDEAQAFINDVENRIIEQLQQDIHPNLISIGQLDRIRFNDFWTHTFRGGLTIAINDTQAFDVTLNSLTINDDGSFEGNFTVVIYDHFGLDEGDVTPGLFPFAGFRAWYRLQRERGFRPFITKVNFSKSFSGNLNKQ